MTASAALGSAPREDFLRALLARFAVRFRVALLRPPELFLAEERFATAALRPPERFLAALLRAVLLREVLRRLRDEPELFRDAPRELPRALRALLLRPPVFRPRVFRPPPPPALFLPRFEPPRDDFLAAAIISAPIKKCPHRRQRTCYSNFRAQKVPRLVHRAPCRLIPRNLTRRNAPR